MGQREKPQNQYEDILEVCSPSGRLLYFSLAGLLKGHSGWTPGWDAAKCESKEVTEWDPL